MTVSFIGDVHGQLEALEALLPQCEGELIFMGDLIDRGPDSRGVVRLVRELCDSGRARCILGNHEFALVSSLGLPQRGVEEKPHFFATWCQIYGGFNTLLSYDVVKTDLASVRKLLLDDLEWMHELPWYLRDTVDGHQYIAVHAGFNGQEPLDMQLAGLDGAALWWHSHDQLPPAIYEHKRAWSNPPDLSDDICVVSGHTVVSQVQINKQRILCDTSGGKPGRYLSAVIWPDGHVVRAATPALDEA